MRQEERPEKPPSLTSRRSDDDPRATSERSSGILHRVQDDLYRALLDALPRAWAGEERPAPETSLQSAVRFVRKRALRGGRLRPVAVRASAWPLLSAFFGVVERFARPGMEDVVAGWPDEVVAIFGPRTRAVAGLPPSSPEELLAGELQRVEVPAVELRIFDEDDLAGHHDHDDHDHAAPEGQPLPHPVSTALRGAELAPLLRRAAAHVPPGHALAPPPSVDPEVRERIRGAIARYLERVA